MPGLYSVVCALVWLGIKVMGGVESSKGKRYGIFVRRVLVGGFAAEDGKFMPVKELNKL